MRRKVNRVGESTLTVSLPRAWVRYHGVKKGDELNVRIHGPALEITTDARNTDRNISLALEGVDRSTLVFFLRYHYRAGAHSVSIRLPEPEIEHHRYGTRIPVRKIVEDEVRTLPGVRIEAHSESSFTLEIAEEADFGSFDTNLRKAFFIISASLEHLTQEREKGWFDDALEIQANFTRHISLCYRLLNNFGFSDFRQTLFLQSMLDSLEMIADIIEDVSRNVHEEEATIDEKTFEIVRMIDEHIKLFTKFYYSFSIERAVEINDRRVEIEARIGKLARKRLADARILSKLATVTLVIRNVIGIRCGLER